MRVRHTVGAEQAVVHVVVVFRLIIIEIPVVTVYHFPVAACPSGRLVHPVPNETALELGIFPDQVPIDVEVAQSVAHGMGIFAHDEGFLFALVLAIFDATGISGIHRAVDIGGGTGVISLFKVDEATGVFLFDPIVTGLEVRTVAALVTQRPQDDARMVEIALHVALVAFQMCFLVDWFFGQRGFLESHAVALQIGFGHKIKAVTVTQLIPVRVVRVVTGPHGIDIELFH